MADRPPDDMGPTPDQVAQVGEGRDDSFEAGGMLLPEITPDAQAVVRKLLGPACLHREEGRKHVAFSWPVADPGPSL